MKFIPATPRGRLARAFSLIELMVSITVLSMLLVIIVQMLEQMQRTWKKTRQTVTEFKDARNAFDELGRRLGQATLNSYYGYKWQSASIPGSSKPIYYGRQITPQSELEFVSGPTNVLFGAAKIQGVGSRPGHAVFFQGPFGFCVQRSKEDRERLQYEQLNSLLNAWGYFVEFNSDELGRPRFLNNIKNAPAPRLRYRLMEFRQPTEYLQIYKLALRESASKNQKDYYRWFTEGLFSVNSAWNTSTDPPGTDTFFRTTRPMAENIIAMFILPRGATVTSSSGTSTSAPEDLAPEYLYDSRRFQWSGAVITSTSAPTISSRSQHQLPPIMDVTFVAVDDASFSNYMLRSGIEKVEDETEIVSKDSFKKASQFDKDMDDLEKKLVTLKIDYRIFSTSIRLRESKWIN